MAWRDDDMPIPSWWEEWEDRLDWSCPWILFNNSSICLTYGTESVVDDGDNGGDGGDDVNDMGLEADPN